MARKLCSPLLIGIGVLLVATASSSAAVTFGTTLGAPISSTPGSCVTVTNGVPVTCTVLTTSVAVGGGIAPGGLVAPSDGVVTRWRVGLGDFGSITSMTATPRVLNNPAFGKLAGVRSGTARAIPSGGGDLTFDERLKVSAGDRFGLDITTVGLANAGPYLTTDTTPFSAAYLDYSPPIADGEVKTLSLISLPTTQRFQINADVEADIDVDGFGDETQDLCPARADVQKACPPPLISKPKLTKSVFSFTSDIPGKATTTLFRTTTGRKVGKKCKKGKPKKGRSCKIYTKFAQWNDDVVAGANTISYAYKVGGKSLKKGSYRATITVVTAQLTVTTTNVDFKIKK